MVLANTTHEEPEQPRDVNDGRDPEFIALGDDDFKHVLVCVEQLVILALNGIEVIVEPWGWNVRETPCNVQKQAYPQHQ